MSARENQRQKLLTRRAALLAGGQAVLGGAFQAGAQWKERLIDVLGEIERLGRVAIAV